MCSIIHCAAVSLLEAAPYAAIGDEFLAEAEASKCMQPPWKLASATPPLANDSTTKPAAQAAAANCDAATLMSHLLATLWSDPRRRT